MPWYECGITITVTGKVWCEAVDESDAKTVVQDYTIEQLRENSTQEYLLSTLDNIDCNSQTEQTNI